MISFPNAKINLGLHIVEKRSDGYHNIETVFYPIALSDALEFVPVNQKRHSELVSESYKQNANCSLATGQACNDGGCCFQQSGIVIDAPIESNLIFKAYLLLKGDFNLPDISVFLQKNIPFGAGLGGGSADAAFMLKMLNEYFDLRLGIAQLENYAARLGSDCPVFIQNKPVFATGRGEVFEAINLSLSGYIALIKPPVFVSTQDAYHNCLPAKPDVSIKDIIRKPVDEWKYLLKNDFENTVFPKFPVIAEIKEKLYQNGAVYASMSGSGSSVFGIFNEKTNLKSQFTDCFVWEGCL